MIRKECRERFRLQSSPVLKNCWQRRDQVGKVNTRDTLEKQLQVRSPRSGAKEFYQKQQAWFEAAQSVDILQGKGRLGGQMLHPVAEVTLSQLVLVGFAAD